MIISLGFQAKLRHSIRDTLQENIVEHVADAQDMNNVDSDVHTEPTLVETKSQVDDATSLVDDQKEKIAPTLVEVDLSNGDSVENFRVFAEKIMNENLPAKERIVANDNVDPKPESFLVDESNLAEDAFSNIGEPILEKPLNSSNFTLDDVYNSSEAEPTEVETGLEYNDDDLQKAIDNMVNEEEDFDLEMDHHIMHEYPLFGAENVLDFFVSQDNEKIDSEMEESTEDPSNVEFIQWQKEHDAQEILDRRAEDLNEAYAQED